MGTARLAIYLVGLVVVVAAVWVFLTQTAVGRSVPAGMALAIILLLVGIGVMASARSINDRRVTSRVTHDAPLGPRYAPPAEYEASGETVVEERRYD
jgi:thiol:disulfide interchange protein